MAGFFERLSRVTVLLSVAAALVLETWLGAREWPALLPWTISVFLAVLVLARLSPAAAWAGVLGVAYILPAIFLATIGRSLAAYQVIWLAAIFAVVIARADWRRWAFPASWTFPLAYWALVIALSWPVVVAREADFHWGMLSYYHIGNSGKGGPPAVGAVMIANVALTQLLGLLSFDYFFGVFGFDRARFRKVVLLPLAASAALGAAMAVYQGLIDISWLSGHQWPTYHRAAGGLVDADADGVLYALWSSGFLALAAPTVVGFLAAIGSSALAWAGLWASGSRMALVAGVACFAATVICGLRVRRWRTGISIGLGIAVVAVALTITEKVRWSSASPLGRAVASLPSLNRESLLRFARTELFDRYQPYGTASVVMVEQFPVTGVGVAGYYQMFPDYAYVLKDRNARADFDNAQSWFRHQLAELGIIGSLGWLWWAMSAGWLLVTTTGEGTARFESGLVKAMLVTTALVSMVSMPTALTPISLTVWIFMFWYLTLSTTAQGRLRRVRWSAGWVPWLIVWLAAAGFTADTYWVGRTALRPPYRAVMADWNYERGFYESEKLGPDNSYRWTADNAVSVFLAKGRYLKLTVWVDHPDVGTRPVDVRIWRKDEPIATMTLHDHAPITWYVRVNNTPPQMMIETRVSRTWKPADYGQKDGRELGLAVSDWAFVDVPPPGAVVIN